MKASSTLIWYPFAATQAPNECKCPNTASSAPILSATSGWGGFGIPLKAVLHHFHDDVVFTSPVAANFFPETAGVIRGKSELRRYWTAVVQAIPDLRFTIEGVYDGIDTLVILYRNQKGGLVSEILRFSPDGLVIEGHGTYLVPE
ncbi:nuclear transport factor 2 family protein [Mycobacterium koreense]|uniref:SnoaL-like domain-containing protein n=1 Tax=Mycolicibacillus koreensis TaxID=1069220 RepID=A0AA91PAB4_9MYCO|nr:nuclear transport factor 2 family protein [Mycolicibacillus koreensis]OSC22836.1 hypothetical protein B8W67_19990 [Mycolicibacillus koreensis]